MSSSMIIMNFCLTLAHTVDIVQHQKPERKTEKFVYSPCEI